jgi:hypothetical protein
MQVFRQTQVVYFAQEGSAMGQPYRASKQACILAGFLFVVSACTPELDLSLPSNEEAVDETGSAPQEVAPLVFTQPSSCTEILPQSALDNLALDGIELTQGPGSGSPDPIFVEGQTPEELVGGISCLYSIPGDDESGVYILLSVAPMTPALRPIVINELVGQGLNSDPTGDGALTYWRWGDDSLVLALHNAVYEDSWYSALMQPGGRTAYDRGVALVGAMRTETTG